MAYEEEFLTPFNEEVPPEEGEDVEDEEASDDSGF